VKLPPIWLLGSSGYSAELAAHVGAGFSLSRITSRDFPPEIPMLTLPRNQFKPSAVGPRGRRICDPRDRGDLRRGPRPEARPFGEEARDLHFRAPPRGRPSYGPRLEESPEAAARLRLPRRWIASRIAANRKGG